MPPRCLLAAAALLAGCGYVGDPLPPTLNLPAAVSDLSAVQRGDRIVVSFTVPGITTDGLILRKLGGVDLRYGPAGAADWEASARRADTDATAPGPASATIPAREWAGQELALRVRAANARGRYGAWSNIVTLRVLPPVGPPSSPRAEAVAGGIRVSWQAAGTGAGLSYRVYRRAGKEQSRSLAGQVQNTEFLDPSTAYGIPYQYWVQAVVRSGDTAAESELAEAAPIIPEDHFAPAAPAGLTAVAGVGAAELAWDRNTEPDLAFYRVYRSEESGPFERVAERVETPSYGDRTVASGKRYVYAVTAVDRAGNESARSAPLEIAIP